MLNMKDQRKCTVHFEDKGMFPKVHWRILEDSGKVPSQSALGARVLMHMFKVGISHRLRWGISYKNEHTCMSIKYPTFIFRIYCSYQQA